MACSTREYAMSEVFRPTPPRAYGEVIEVVPPPEYALQKLHAPAKRLGVSRIPMAALILLAPIVVFGIFGPLLMPHDPTMIDPAKALRPPAFAGGTWAYPLGTDHTGRDLLSRLIDGARNSLAVAFFGVALAGAFGTAIGVTAGFLRGAADEVLMRLVDMQLAIPTILLAVLLAAVIGGGLTTVIVSLMVTFWGTYARVVRGETLVLMQRDYVALARVAGASRWRIVRYHVLPNLLSMVVILATLQLGAAVGLEAALTFLGLGIQPPASAWGLMIADGKMYMSQAWWIPTIPGVAIVVTVFGANLLGDWVRDRLDPRVSRL